MESDIRKMELMRREWMAWLHTGNTLKELGFDESWNDPKLKKLHAQVVLWSELVAALRVTQDKDIQDSALNGALRALAVAE